jgi:hypothetical protein
MCSWFGLRGHTGLGYSGGNSCSGSELLFIAKLSSRGVQIREGETVGCVHIQVETKLHGQFFTNIVRTVFSAGLSDSG